jgi:hypothetical protein
MTVTMSFMVTRKQESIENDPVPGCDRRSRESWARSIKLFTSSDNKLPSYLQEDPASVK